MLLCAYCGGIILELGDDAVDNECLCSMKECVDIGEEYEMLVKQVKRLEEENKKLKEWKKNHESM